MEELIGIFDFTTIKLHIVWVVITISLLIVAMLIDLITGVQKAKKNGVARSSRGYKMTCTKAEKYFLPLLCLALMDMLGSVIIPVPAFTMLYGAFCIFCEFRSVMEKTHEKQEILDAATTMNVIIKNKDDIAQLVSQSIEHILSNKDKENENNRINESKD